MTSNCCAIRATGLLATLLLAACQTAKPAARAAPVPALERYAGEIEAFRLEDAARPPAACQTLFVGSSSIRMWDDIGLRFRFPIVRRGVGGSTIAEINHYFGDIVAPYRPSRIVLYAGENDLNEGKSAAQTMADLRQFVALKRNTLGTTPLYYVSAKPSPSRADDFDKQRQFNALAREYADQEPDVRFIDVAAAMMPGGALRTDIFRDDQLHMQASGYDIWTRAIGEALARPTQSRAPGC